MSAIDTITRTFCAEPRCDVKDFFSAYCQSEGHARRIVEYVPAEVLSEIAEIAGKPIDQGEDLYGRLVVIGMKARRAGASPSSQQPKETT